MLLKDPILVIEDICVYLIVAVMMYNKMPIFGALHLDWEAIEGESERIIKKGGDRATSSSTRHSLSEIESELVFMALSLFQKETQQQGKSC